MGFIRAEGKQLTRDGERVLLRGFGLGGWLLPEGYMWKLAGDCDRPRRIERLIEELCGGEYAEGFWRTYFDRYITREDIALLARRGYNSVRVPLNARHLCEVKGERVELKAETAGRLDRLLGWCGEYGVYVILDMHAAPGGQTGQNIDDSLEDKPGLFMEERFRRELAELWRLLAERYAGEEMVAGYDLLNEPLPDFFREYNGELLPLYRELIRTIRQVDENHLIILEGAHWATDFTVLDGFDRREEDNVLLQFHKYWNNPDRESLEKYVQAADRLGVPLFMGEGGENNLDWYTVTFPMLEREGIGWSFWSYKKMDCSNSPLTFPVPEGWGEILSCLEGGGRVETRRAREIFDSFLDGLDHCRVNEEVFRALDRRTPVSIPAVGFDGCRILHPGQGGAMLRTSEPAEIVFADGREGEPDYRRYNGEAQPESERLLVRLREGDELTYRFRAARGKVKVRAAARGSGVLAMEIQGRSLLLRAEGEETEAAGEYDVTEGESVLTVRAVKGVVELERIDLG